MYSSKCNNVQVLGADKPSFFSPLLQFCYLKTQMFNDIKNSLKNELLLK